MEKKYTFLNNVVGWIILLFASAVYIMTIEPTASFWDCGEFIASAVKQQVGHPPGAPLWLMIARLFGAAAGDNLELIARNVNIFSALCSSFSILFLFWSITALAKKIAVQNGPIDMTKTIVIMASGIVGATAYTFSDSFWFSAVEAEVYASSSLFTALVFWLALKWDANAHKPFADRYLILIAYFMGLSIGVHILNLLALPALVYVYYFRRKEHTTPVGFILAGVIGVGALGVVQRLIISETVNIAAKVELFFVNSLGMSYDSGMWFYFLIIGALIAFGIWFSYFKKWPEVQKVVLSVMVILIGYSSFAMIVIRSAANPPMDENNPENILSLLPYLNREQYGDRPLMFGQSFNSKLDIEEPYVDGSPVYYRPEEKVEDLNTGILVETRGETVSVKTSSKNFENIEAGDIIVSIDGKKVNPKLAESLTDLSNLRPDLSQAKISVKIKRGKKSKSYDLNLQSYRIADERKNHKPNYNKKTCMYFPRMYSSQSHHVNAYKAWSGFKGKKVVVEVADRSGRVKKERVRIPKFSENLAFLSNYQINFMYWRYFMWNFTGRQNDLQGHGRGRASDMVLKGNWLSGVPFIDNAHIGDQESLPDSIKDNHGRNQFYFLPFILGLIGMIFHFSKHKKDAWVVMLLFIMTGFAIIIYLNQTPFQPRERDYAYAGSFYAFAIWIGLGVQAIYSMMTGTGKTEEEIMEEKGIAGYQAKLISLGIFEISVAASSFLTLGTFGILSPEGKVFGLSCLYIAIVIAGITAACVLIGKIVQAGNARAIIALALTIGVPGIMGAEGWDDHDRSNRYTARDFAKNYLDTCEKNAIIFTNGDNDTFPLWYVQEVEGYRTDIRVVNLSLLNTDWYIDQMKRKAYKSDPVPFSLTQDQYRQGTRDYVFVQQRWQGYADLNDAMNFVKSDDQKTKIKASSGDYMDYLPTNKFSVPVNKEKVLANGTVLPQFADQIPDKMDWQIGNGAVLKAKLMILDLLATNDWERPIYFAITVGDDHYMKLQEYFQAEGLAYRVTPIKHDNNGNTGWINVDKMYENMVEKYRWGNMEKDDVYVDEQVLRMTMNYRNNFARLARELVSRGDKERALKTLDKCMEIMPPHKIPFSYYSMYLADAYYMAGEMKKGDEIMTAITEKYIGEMNWYMEQEDVIASRVKSEMERALQALQTVQYFADKNWKKVHREDKFKADENSPVSRRIDEYMKESEGAISDYFKRIDKTK